MPWQKCWGIVVSRAVLNPQGAHQMPSHSSKAILRDILEYGLDPTVPHTQFQKNGRLALADKHEESAVKVEPLDDKPVDVQVEAPVAAKPVEEKKEAPKSKKEEPKPAEPEVQAKAEAKPEVKKEEPAKVEVAMAAEPEPVVEKKQAKKVEKPADEKPQQDVKPAS
jgi:hypothetical protein